MFLKSAEIYFKVINSVKVLDTEFQEVAINRAKRTGKNSLNFNHTQNTKVISRIPRLDEIVFPSEELRDLLSITKWRALKTSMQLTLHRPNMV